MEGKLDELIAGKCSVLLELAASDDLVAFKKEVEEKGLDLAEASLWYGRRIGSRKMGFEERTPLVIAAMYGSVDVLKFIVGSGKADLNGACGADGVTALHCAVAGGACSSVEIVKLLLDASADANCVDANGNKPVDLIMAGLKSLSGSRRKVIELLLQGGDGVGVDPEDESEKTVPPEKKEYPVDVSLPDINNGIYGTDDFRMYTFKVKPCSRAYSHDWTECPFVHPGENARRRDPRKYPYSCVPCPEFRKGACPKGDACDYALGSSALPLPTVSTPPMSPLASSASPKNGGLWQNKMSLTPCSRLKTAFSARDFDLEMEILGLKNQLQQQQLMDEISSLSSPSRWSKEYNRHGDLKPTNLDDGFGSIDPSLLSPLKGHAHQIRQNQLRASYPTNLPSSPARSPSPFGFDSSAAVMNSRSTAFAKRSQSFIDRGRAGLTAPSNSATMTSSNISDWSSPDGKLDWGMQGDELNKLRKSASFRFRNNSPAPTTTKDTMMQSNVYEPDVSWVNSLVRDATPSVVPSLQQQYNIGKGVRERLPPWVEQMYIEQEQMVA